MKKQVPFAMKKKNKPMTAAEQMDKLIQLRERKRALMAALNKDQPPPPAKSSSSSSSESSSSEESEEE